MLQVRLYRPFSAPHFWRRCPTPCAPIAVLERTKEPGAPGEPLYLDVVATLAQAVARGQRATMPRVDRRPLRLSSKDFSPAMVKAVFDELTKPEPQNGFTVGINDDVCAHQPRRRSDLHDRAATDVVRAVFYGLGADGTVGANKNSVKIIAEDAGLYAQGYFVYDFAQIGRADRVASALRAASRSARPI